MLVALTCKKGGTYETAENFRHRSLLCHFAWIPGAAQETRSTTRPSPTAQSTALPSLAGLADKKYQGVWLTPHGIGLTGVELAFAAADHKRLSGEMTFFPRTPRGSACGGVFPATGFFLKDGRLRVSVDRTVHTDGSQSTCGDKPVFFLRMDGPRLETPHLKLSER